MPRTSEKQQILASITSTAESILLTAILNVQDDDSNENGVHLVQSLSLATNYLSSFRYLHPRGSNRSAGRQASDDLDDVIYSYPDASFLESSVSHALPFGES